MQHVFQYGFALSLAGRIVVAVVSDLCFRGVAPPEFGHGDRLPTPAIGVLQQLWGTAFARSGRWRLLGGGGKEGAEVLLLAARVQHTELAEEAHLQVGRPLSALLLQGFYLLFVGVEGVGQQLDFLYPAAFQALVFGLQELAFAYQGSGLFGGGAVQAAAFALGFGLLQLLLGRGEGVLHGGLTVVQLQL